MQVKYFNLWN